MKRCVIKIIGLFIVCLISISSFAQIDKKDILELNTILKNSLYKTTMEIDKNGMVNRIDDNSNSFTYKLSDLSIVKYEFDGFHNAIVVLKKDKKAKCVVDGKNRESDINVIAFANKADCDKAIEIFKKFINTTN